jgi:hypothetical protein
MGGIHFIPHGVFNEGFRAADPFHGKDQWRARPLVIRIVVQKESATTMTIDVFRKFESTELLRTLEFAEDGESWRVVKITGGGIRRA